MRHSMKVKITKITIYLLLFFIFLTSLLNIKLYNTDKRLSSVVKVINFAYNALGKPYINGGNDNSGYDCSGLVFDIYSNELNIKLPRTTKEQVEIGKKIDIDNIVPGDLLFFNTYKDEISHVGIYIGNEKMIHASSGKGVVSIDSISSDYFKKNFIIAKRIID